MRGRKHPLEIFRQSGDSFLTTRETPGSERRPARPEREPPRDDDERDGDQRPGESQKAAVAPPGKRTKRELVLAKSGSVQRRPAAGGRRVRSWVYAAGGLVLVAGLAYAAKLRFSRGNGASSDHGVTLQRDETIRSKWPDHALPANGAETKALERESAAGAANAGNGSKEPAAKPAAKAPEKKREYWIVAASVKLSEQERSKPLPELRKELFKNEEQRLHRSLDAEIERLGFRVQTVATNQKTGEFVLRVGCAMTADDPDLKSLLAKVGRLGKDFKNATIRDYPPAATK
jgi:hypothetical protein